MISCFSTILVQEKKAMNSPLPSEDKWGTWVLAVLQPTLLQLYAGKLGMQFAIDGSWSPWTRCWPGRRWTRKWCNLEGCDHLHSSELVVSVHWNHIALFSPNIPFLYILGYLHPPPKAWDKDPNSVCLDSTLQKSHLCQIIEMGSIF